MGTPNGDLQYTDYRALAEEAESSTEPNYDTCDDTQLVDAYFSGQGGAFKELTLRHQARVRMIAQRYARTDFDTDDIVQETLLKISKNLHKYRGEAALTTWIYRVTTNMSYDFVQKAARRNPIPVDMEEASPQMMRYLSHDPGEQRMLKLSVAQALELLAPEKRHAIFLVDYLGFSVEDAADIVGVRPGTMKSRRARARKQLRHLLEITSPVA